jgi:hypothetical protein
MKRTQFIGLICAVILLQGCAFTKATLDIAATPGVKVAGPISDIPSLQLVAPALDDKRIDRARIGWKRNGYGQNTADITSLKPVDEIIENAVSKAFTDNNHKIDSTGPIRIIGSVERFWFETDVNFWTVGFIGDVRCNLEFVDSRTSQTIYKGEYAGTHSETKAGGLEKTWTLVMNQAVDKMIESIVLDEKLADALRAVRAALTDNERPAPAAAGASP